MHAKPDLRVVLKWMIAGSGSVITAVIQLRGLAVNASKKRRFFAFRFSVKTALIFTGIVALLFWQLERFDRPRRVIASIEEIGGFVTFINRSNSTARSESWIWNYLPQCYFDTELNEEIIQQLPTLGSIEFFDFNATNVQDAHLRYLQNIKSIHMIEFGSTAITDRGIENLVQLQSLEILYLDGENISSDAIMKLTGLPSLKKLILQNVTIDETSKELLLAEMPNCEITF